MTCPPSLWLSQAFSSGADAELQEHLLGCPFCAAEWRALEQTRELGQKLPFVIPDKARSAEVRRRLLASAAKQPVSLRRLPRWRRALWAGMAAAALLGVVLGSRLTLKSLRNTQTVDRWRAAVQSQGASRFVHERAGEDEWVRLSEGTVLVDVHPLRPGERFRVLCGDCEIEVRGTAFETVVEHDRLQRVQVLHGLVEVRPEGRPSALLSAGQRWQATSVQNSAAAVSPPSTSPPKPSAAAAVEVPRPAAGVSPPSVAGGANATPSGKRPAPAPPVRPPTPTKTRLALRAEPLAGHQLDVKPPAATAERTAVSPAEQAFMSGWDELRKGQHRLAAESFARAIATSSPTDGASLTEDASFWHAVALSRSGQQQPAVEALADFLRHHPTAPRFGEAAAILGWHLLKAGSVDEAERYFGLAAQDSHAPIRDNARAGLNAVAAQRQRGTQPPPNSEHPAPR